MAIDNMIPLPGQSPVVATPPQTSIYICNVPWDNNYKHVRDFGSSSAANSYIIGRAIFPVINESTPVRVGMNYTVEIPKNEFESGKGNYIAFRNMPFDSTWYYAFITDVSWNSNTSCTIHFELDVFQNEFYGITLHPCFVEYEHIAKADDQPGANTVPEGDETGDYVYYGNQYCSFGLNKLIVYIAGGTEGGVVEGELVNNIYTGVSTETFECTSAANVGTINDFLTNFSGNLDAIIAMYMYPAICDPGASDAQAVIGNESIYGDYTPVNKKLLTYPYCFVTSDDHRGNTDTYKFELSNFPTSIAFRSTGVLATTPSVFTRPTSYKGLDQDYTSAITTTNFPIVGWSNDAFQAYLAQNRSTLALTALTQGAQIVAGAAVGGAGGAAIASSGIGAVIGTSAKISDAKAQPNSGRGKPLSENTAFALNLNRIDFYATGIRAEMARRIDSRMSVYGYKTNLVKVPNIRNRSSWNFVKTIDCSFTGNTDKDTLAKIREIFDSGVTLWHTNDIGNYGLANN